MTKGEFEQEFNERIKRHYNTPGNNLDWHNHVLTSMHKLSDEALVYILEHEGDPFGQWMVSRANLHCFKVFEDIVLKS